MTAFASTPNCATDCVAITKSDATEYSPAPRALYVGTGGDVKIDTLNGTTVTFTNVPAGAILPVVFTKVYSADTTASGFVGLY